MNKINKQAPASKKSSARKRTQALSPSTPPKPPAPAPAAPAAQQAAAAKVAMAKAATAKAAKAAKAAETATVKPVAAKTGKKPAKPRPVLVRDSFTMPEADFALIAQLKATALQGQRAAKKSELLRAGLQLLAGLDAASLVLALDQLEAVKTGRPRKGH